MMPAYETRSAPPISNTRAAVERRGRAPRAGRRSRPRSRSAARRCAPSAGVIITGRRSTSARIISNDRLPEPMTIDARNSIDRHAGRAQDPADLLTAGRWRERSLRRRRGRRGRRCARRRPRAAAPPKFAAASRSRSLEVAVARPSSGRGSRPCRRRAIAAASESGVEHVAAHDLGRSRRSTPRFGPPREAAHGSPRSSSAAAGGRRRSRSRRSGGRRVTIGPSTRSRHRRRRDRLRAARRRCGSRAPRGLRHRRSRSSSASRAARSSIRRRRTAGARRR